MIFRSLLGLVAVFTIVGCSNNHVVVDKNYQILYGGKVPAGGVGIALAGGGTKAASYSMGVLGAVADADMFKDIDVISSVSGGGYAAFYLYSKMMLREQFKGRITHPSDKDLFADCIPRIYEKLFINHEAIKDRICKDDETFKYQEFVRCRQDVLENDCNQQMESKDFGEISRTGLNTAMLVLATGMSTVNNFAARSIFDWPVNVSPSRAVYKEGIGTGYGLFPLNRHAFDITSNISDNCEGENFINCTQRNGGGWLDRGADGRSMSFDKLKDFMDRSDSKVPVWVINATASKSRSIFGWGLRRQRDFSKYTLQMSPYGARSGFYGEVPNYKKQLDLLDAVTASAAFLDSNETAVKWPPLKFTFAALQHLLVLDWGKDIDNPKVSEGWRRLHNGLFFPLYYVDGLARQVAGVDENQHSGYIRLLDGGNNDNLGAYTLVEAKLGDIFISDHSQDNKGKMTDMCQLHNEVKLRSNGEKKLVIPGLAGFSEHCAAILDDSECTDDSCEEMVKKDRRKSDKKGYPIYGWKHNVLLGCITPSKDSELCDGTVEARIYLLKPALDLETFSKQYVDENNKVKPEACMSESGTCEVAAYIADQFQRHGKRDDIGDFPQNSTVKTTHASTGKLYGALRELARWQMKEALELKNLTRAGFSKKVKDQFINPITLE